MDLRAVYPDNKDSQEEISFEELRANHRGWLHRDWSMERKQRTVGSRCLKDARESYRPGNDTTEHSIGIVEETPSQSISQRDSEKTESPSTIPEATIAVDTGRENKGGRQRKTKSREVNGETQTSMLKSIVDQENH